MMGDYWGFLNDYYLVELLKKINASETKLTQPKDCTN